VIKKWKKGMEGIAILRQGGGDRVNAEFWGKTGTCSEKSPEKEKKHY